MYFLSTNKIKSDTDSKQFGKIIPLHIEWTKNHISRGSILQAGKWGASGGMSIIKAENCIKAEKILKDDPLVKSGLVTYEFDEFCPHVPINHD